MSAAGMAATVLATELAEAVAKDETPEAGGCDISAGMYGPNASEWLRKQSQSGLQLATIAHMVDSTYDEVLEAIEFRRKHFAFMGDRDNTDRFMRLKNTVDGMKAVAKRSTE